MFEVFTPFRTRLQVTWRGDKRSGQLHVLTNAVWDLL